MTKQGRWRYVLLHLFTLVQQIFVAGSNISTQTTRDLGEKSLGLRDNFDFGGNLTSAAAHQPRADKRPLATLYVNDRTRDYLNWLRDDWFQKVARASCSTQCIITDDKTNLPLADVVIFYAPTHSELPVAASPGPPAARRTKSTLYVMVSTEQPKYASILSNVKYLETHFDLMVTYSLREKYPGTNIPNLPITYYPLNMLSPNAIRQPPRSFVTKDAFGTGVSVAMFISNCHSGGATTRYKYIEELLRHIKVHSYGTCFHNREEPILNAEDDLSWPPIEPVVYWKKVRILSHYKFYLAFENSAVDDYVSEKVFEGLLSGSVPVYRGAATISQFMPSNDSFINANEMTPSELAALLHRLTGNETLYANYLAYKNREIPKTFVDIAKLSYVHPNVACRLCDYAVKLRKDSKAKAYITSGNSSSIKGSSSAPVV